MINKILTYCVQKGCSDVHIAASALVNMRVDGEILPVPGLEPLNKEQVYTIIKSITTEVQFKEYMGDFEKDFSLQIREDLRFRVNAYHTVKGPSIVFRKIPSQIHSLESLGIPEVVSEFADYQNGLVLIVGPTGSGKSTTLTSLVDKINSTKSRHIITIEDPVEFIHKNKKSIVNQREVGNSTHSFSLALKNALREDPDVILVGEIRDLETMQLSLTAAETGHLVLATLHTNSAAHTINRIIDVFPPRDKASVRSMLSASLKAILAQHLIIGKDGGRLPATELMFANNSIRNLIREDNVHQLNSIIQISKKDKMHLMRDSVTELLEKGLISEITAKEALLY